MKLYHKYLPVNEVRSLINVYCVVMLALFTDSSRASKEAVVSSLIQGRAWECGYIIASGNIFNKLETILAAVDLMHMNIITVEYSNL